jgi:hypothetical protein
VITDGAYNKWRKKSQIFKLITNNNKYKTMKKSITNVSHFLYALLATVLLYGCSNNNEPKIIVQKSYTTFVGTAMPKGICRFGYEDGSFGVTETQEKCDCYNVGDTIR